MPRALEALGVRHEDAVVRLVQIDRAGAESGQARRGPDQRGCHAGRVVARADALHRGEQRLEVGVAARGELLGVRGAGVERGRVVA